MTPIINILLNAPKIDTKIYGVSWNKSSNPVLTRTDASVELVANAGVDSTPVGNAFDNIPIFRDIVKVADTLGNVFVRIPKFYINKTDGVDYKTWQVSKKQYPGFYLPWCFWDFTNSRELPYIDVGKYTASKVSTKLQSVSGVAPLVSATIANFRTYAQNNNTGGLLGYQQLDIHVVDVLQTLFYIEFATLNSQSIMMGNVSTSAAIQNGQTDNVVASSGSYSSNSSGLYSFKYRGIENLWGNIWQNVDGLNINGTQGWVCLDAASYASNVFASPYVQLGYFNGSSTGNIKAAGWDTNYPFASLPLDATGSTSTYYCDAYYLATGNLIALFGGSWVAGLSGGLSEWHMGLASSNSGVYFGGRLVRKAL